MARRNDDDASICCVILILIGVAIYYWYITVPIIVLIITGVVLRKKKKKRKAEEARIQKEMQKQEAEKNRIIAYEQGILMKIDGELKLFQTYPRKKRVIVLSEMIEKLNTANFKYHIPQKEDLLKNLKYIHQVESQAYNAEKRQEVSEKLTKLFKITNKIKIEDICRIMDLKRNEFMNFLLDNPAMLGNFVVEGDFISIKSGVSLEDGLGSFMAGLDAQFDDWESKEESKYGKIEEFGGSNMQNPY